MRPRALALSLASVAAVIGGALQVGQAVAQPISQATTSQSTNPPEASSSSSSTSSSTSASSSTTTTPSASATPTPTTTKSSSAGATGTFVGATEETRYGPVQVEIIVANGKVTDVKALQLTDQDPRSVQISASAAPVLREEALTAQSAQIDTVSGATYTSDGYVASLQSALDKAGL